MTTYYEDRAGFFLDGAPMFPGFTIQSVTWSGDLAVSAVPGMTPDHSGAGWVQGNFEGDISVTVAVPLNGLQGAISPLTYDWPNSNAVIQIYGSSYLYGQQYKGDVLQFLGLAFKRYPTSGFSGVGRVETYQLNFGATQMVIIPGG